MMSMNPGPAHIHRGANPGGIVVQVYDPQTNVKLIDRDLSPGMTFDTIRDAVLEDERVCRDRATARNVYVVFYDGDTGERMVAAEVIARMA